MFNQIYSYFNNIPSKYHCDFPQGYTTQHCWLVVIKKWKEVLDKARFGGILLKDLSKVLDFLKRDFPIAEFLAYGFDSQSLSFIFSYLSGRFHRTKTNNAYKKFSNRAFTVQHICRYIFVPCF